MTEEIQQTIVPEEQVFEQQISKIVNTCTDEQLKYMYGEIEIELSFRKFASDKVAELKAKLKSIESDFNKEFEKRKQIKQSQKESDDEEEEEQKPKPKPKRAPAKKRSN